MFVSRKILSHYTAGKHIHCVSLYISVSPHFYFLLSFCLSHWLSFSQSKIHAARSLNEIAIDLTETGTLKTSKLANMGSKGKIISGSSGSLLSSG